MASIQRRKTVTAMVGGVRVGSDAPVVVQSMTNTDTADVPSTVQQVAALARAGSELVRVTVNNDEAAAAMPRIVEQLDKQGVSVPIIGDFHYNGHQLLTKYPECARDLAKYRINPGNVGIGRKDDGNFRTMIEVAVKYQKPVRIGVNWGSLDQALLTRMMDENSRLDEPKDAREVSKLLRQPRRTQRAYHHRFHVHFACVFRFVEARILVHHAGQQRLVERSPVHADAHRLLILHGDFNHRAEIRIASL